MQRRPARQRRIPATFMRGGTSKAIVFHARNLPPRRDDWAPIFVAAIGAGDPNGRQLDGMGGGVSSLSKVCVVGPPTRPDADIDYTFAQIGVTTPVVDYAGNCGNMSSAMGPFAVDEGLVPAPRDGEATVRIHNTNTGKIIVARFPVVDGEAAVDGELTLDGVAGSGAPIRLEFLDPGGSRTGQLLPTGRAVDTLTLSNGERIEASLVDTANPCLFVAASALGLAGNELPATIERDPALLARLEDIRRAGSVAMGLARDMDEAGRIASVPKIALVSTCAPARTLAGDQLRASDMDIAVRMISVGQAHRATPLTGALCLAVAARIPGSIPFAATDPAARDRHSLRIAHPSGITLVDAEVTRRADGTSHAVHATVYRTARRLFDGHVLVRRSAVGSQ